ncbi:Dagla, partial [Symbiodinium pilosum]
SRAAGPARATFRLFRRSVAGPSAVRLDPLSDAAELLHQTLKDLALTKEQQEVFERVVSCNSRFWQVAVDGCLDGSPPWRRHVALNLALLRAYHRHLAAQRIVDALELDVSEVQTSNHNSLNYSEAVEALRYCRWALAAYGGRGKRDGTEKINADGTSKMAAPVSEPLQLGMGEEERVAMAAAVAECSPTAIIISDLDDASQASDPLCPRFLLAEDVQHQELIVSVRGTQSLSDLLADLVGDAEDFAGDYAQLEIERIQFVISLESLEQFCHLEMIWMNCRPQQAERRRRRGSVSSVESHFEVCEILAILLLGGDENVERVPWTLPKDTELRCFLFAPPPVFGNELAQRSSFPRLFSFGFRPSVPSAVETAVEKARKVSVAFALNYDIIPRTSLHNGYKLFQEARVIDDFVGWGKRDVLRKLGLVEPESQVAVAHELEDALSKGASARPAPANPFPAQHAVTSRLFHMMLVPGGTATAPITPSDATHSASDGLTGPEDDALEGPRANGRWLLKRSDHLRQWRRRFAWIEAGELCFAASEKDPIRSTVPLTADSTLIMLLGEPSCLPFPAGMSPTMSFRADQVCSGTTTCSTTKTSRDFATPWAFHVQTASSWSGIERPDGGHSPTLPAIRTCVAGEVFLCTETAAERDMWLRDLASAVRAARRRWVRGWARFFA